MIIKSDQAHGDCDVCERPGATHAAIAKGATGRYCEVMWLCKPCAIGWVDGEEGQILPAEEARLGLESIPGNYCDF